MTGEEVTLAELWTAHAVRELVLSLRRTGVRAYEGVVCPDGSVLFSFERESLSQRAAVENALLAWPTVGRVRHVAPGLVRAYRHHEEAAPGARCRPRSRSGPGLGPRWRLLLGRRHRGWPGRG